MYSLLVSHFPSESIEMDRPRFLEGTEDSLKAPLVGLSHDAIDFLKAIPCLLMEEGRAEEVARLAQITSVSASRHSIRIGLKSSPKPKLVNADIWRSRASLEITPLEFNRNHWAVKKVDLFAGLASEKFAVPREFAKLFGQSPLPGPARAQLLAAKRSLAERSHTEIDDFLLEVGIPDLTAGREIGSKHDRANAIVQYALAHPEAITAESRLLSVHIVEMQKAAPPAGDPEFTQLPTPPVATQAKEKARITAIPNRVFVVHGRNEIARREVVAFLTSLGVEAVVLHDRPNMGRHLLTKFIDEAGLVAFAVVLMTADDVGAARGGREAPRARQNVILELGYFLSHLGLSKVCALVTPGLETPSDFNGIVYVEMDQRGRWKVELKRELAAAGMPLNGL